MPRCDGYFIKTWNHYSVTGDGGSVSKYLSYIIHFCKKFSGNTLSEIKKIPSNLDFFLRIQKTGMNEIAFKNLFAYYLSYSLFS